MTEKLQTASESGVGLSGLLGERFDLNWLRENAFFSCEQCEKQSHSQNCYHADELRLFCGHRICDGCYDVVAGADIREFSDLAVFDPFDFLR